MESVSSFFKEENDIFYIVGEKRGIEKERKEGHQEGREEGREERDILFVKNLLTQTDFTDERIAQVADVSIAFVEKIRASLYLS